VKIANKSWEVLNLNLIMSGTETGCVVSQCSGELVSPWLVTAASG